MRSGNRYGRWYSQISRRKADGGARAGPRGYALPVKELFQRAALRWKQAGQPASGFKSHVNKMVNGLTHARYAFVATHEAAPSWNARGVAFLLLPCLLLLCVTLPHLGQGFPPRLRPPPPAAITLPAATCYDLTEPRYIQTNRRWPLDPWRFLKVFG